MPKKPDLSKAFGERFKTEEKVDVQDPIAAAIQSSMQESQPEDTNARMHARMHARIDGSEQERIVTLEEAYIGKGVIIEVLYDRIQQKRHLSNSSFRYRADELEKLDHIFRELEARKPGRISKNDIARMALIAFYEDYEKNGDESILAQVFKRM